MVAAAPCASWRSFRDSLKVLEANIQHANTLASECSRDYDRACLQMRMSYSPAVRIFLFLMQWTNCSLAGAVYVDGTTTMSTHERKASIREFYRKRSVHNREQQQMLSLRKYQRKTGGTTVWQAELY